jgi:hypothetical protein
MSRILTYDVWAILHEYNCEEFHLRHAAIMAGVMGYFASLPRTRWSRGGM